MDGAWRGAKSSRVAVGAAALMLSMALHAQQLSLSIPPGDLKAALNAYIAATGMQVAYRDADVKGLSSNGVQGPMTPNEALDRLLEGTTLRVRRDTSGAAVVYSSTKQGEGAALAAQGTSSNPEILDRVEVTGVASHLASENRTGTRLDADPMTVPLSVTTVEKGLLDQQQSLTLRDAVSNVAGVTEIDGAGTYTMRGFTAGIMRNGNLVTAPTGIDVPLIAISRLEVVKGPEAIIAGVSAGYGGVINIISKTPQVAPVTEVTATGGSRGYYEVSADVGRPLTEDNSFLGRLVVSKQGSGTNAYGYDGPTNNYVAPSLTWRNKDTRTEVTLQYEYQKRRTPAPGTVITGQTYLTDDLQTIRTGSRDGTETKNDIYTLNLNQFIFDGWQVGLNYVDERRRGVTNGSFPLPGALLGFGPSNVVLFGSAADASYNSRTLKLELKGHFDTGPLEHNLLLAFDEARRHIINGQASTSLTDIDTSTGVVTDLVPILGAAFGVPSPRVTGGVDPVEKGVLLLDQVQWNDWVALAGVRAIRYEPNSQQAVLPEFRKTLPTLGLVYRVSPNLSLYGNASKGFTPNSGNVTFGGGPVAPENAQQAEVGVKSLLLDQKGAITAAVFDIKQKNVAVADPLHPGTVCIGGNVCYISVPGIQSRGAEVEISGQFFRHVEVRANYTYLLKTTDTPNLPSPSYAKNQFNLWTIYRFGDVENAGAWVGGGVQARSARNYADSSAANPGRGRLDLSTGYDTKYWSAIAGVKNATDRRQYTLQSGLFNLGVAEQPREFYVTARAHF